ncbi:hypothetical protein [Mycolicibacterium aubagnense]|uniref:Uncharacterized protein n=1 Tax=Mycolicibacterium aubagnense TaxID=319707 RepID=A0ABN5YMM0_9MYCO|nr:hypothetical protein [Mycolicibacterium aubagnense]TLH64443.1 hypothetical protein C1S80_12220 [Mycolicibacterium aubagnense]BBX82177.1 hypothetical protein MAUB_00500 [Mycolicibacterium aubagnense]
MAPKFVSTNLSGQAYQARIHAAGCADVERERGRGHEVWPVPESVTTFAAFAEVEFGDIATDVAAAGTDEWRKECLYNASEVKVLPCATAAGFTA